jgi:hypothetical protein
MKFIAPAVALLIAIGAFFGYVDPTYDKIKNLSEEIDAYDEALGKSRELAEVRDDLLLTYNSFEEGDVSRLRKLIPDNVDNVRLIMDIDSIASRYGMTLRGVSVAGGPDNQSQSEGIQSDAGIQSINLTFTVSSSYENYVRFLEDLERSLRLIDVVSVSFNASEVNLYEFNTTITTYWLQ